MEQQNQQPIQEKTENKPSIKTNWKYIVIVVVLGLVSVGGILLLRGMTPPPVAQTPQLPEPSPQAIDNQQLTVDTSTWQTYRNEEFGLEMKYP